MKIGYKTRARSATLAALLGLSLLLGGCAAPTQKLSQADRSTVKAAKINESVQKVPEVFLLAPSGANIGLMFGAVGGLASHNAIQEPRKPFEAYLQKNGISVEKIVREEVELGLRQSRKLAITDNAGPGVAIINISVQQYGFGVTHLLGSKVVPVLMVKCDMVDASGRLLWTASDRLLPSVAHPMDSTSWEELRDNPRKIEEQWRKAARLIVKKIVSDL